MRRGSNREFYAPYDPETGLGSPLARFPLKVIGDHILYLPEEMRELEVIQEILRFDSLLDFVAITFPQGDMGAKLEESLKEINQRRFHYDFEYWAFKTIIINKPGVLRLDYYPNIFKLTFYKFYFRFTTNG